MMNRRTFLHQAGAFASAAIALPLTQTRPRYKMGLQLYTMRAAMRRDLDDTLKRIAGMGYEEVETYGFDPAELGYYGLTAKAFAGRLQTTTSRARAATTI